MAKKENKKDNLKGKKDTKKKAIKENKKKDNRKKKNIVLKK